MIVYETNQCDLVSSRQNCGICTSVITPTTVACIMYSNAIYTHSGPPFHMLYPITIKQCDRLLKNTTRKVQRLVLFVNGVPLLRTPQHTISQPFMILWDKTIEPLKLTITFQKNIIVALQCYTDHLYSALHD